MQPIQQAFEPVSICFASDDNYAPYLKVAIYSLLCNRNRERSYDIIILHKRISKEHQGEILGLVDGKSGVSIRFVNVVEADRELQSDVGCYYAVETNYRLLLFSKLFQNYRRMLYLDCDIIVTGDVGELFDVDLEGKSAAGVEDVGFRITLSDAAPIGGLKPCANVTYESLNDCAYDEIICVILTGMGADGTQGIIELQKHKKVHTIAQDAKSCVVYGMPKAIAEAGAADEIVPLTEIAQAIIKNVGVK